MAGVFRISRAMPDGTKRTVECPGFYPDSAGHACVCGYSRWAHNEKNWEERPGGVVSVVTCNCGRQRATCPTHGDRRRGERRRPTPADEWPGRVGILRTTGPDRRRPPDSMEEHDEE